MRNSMQPPVITKQLARRIQAVIDASHLDGTIQVRQQPGNPYDFVVQRFGNATAYMACGIPFSGWWNRVVGLTLEESDKLDDILGFFRGQHLQCNIDLAPTEFTSEFAQLLIQHGLYPTPNGTVLYGWPQVSNQALSQGVSIKEISLDDIDLFLELWADGFEFPAGPQRKVIMDIRKGAFSAPGSRLYIASVNETPAAMAGLYIHDGIAYLSGGATLPAFRKHGCHTALTQRRMRDAAEAGCELAIGFAGTFGSISQNNMERAGLRIAYLMTVWVDESV
ncbi:MAG TPA: GNAT family N-acetyltransferase [Ktedonobacteraceae bacterium]|nr:GNAT family N-acetyltransferase [Ktedonobacteraceae bacterium]